MLLLRNAFAIPDSKNRQKLGEFLSDPNSIMFKVDILTRYPSIQECLRQLKDGLVRFVLKNQ